MGNNTMKHNKNVSAANTATTVKVTGLKQPVAHATSSKISREKVDPKQKKKQLLVAATALDVTSKKKKSTAHPMQTLSSSPKTPRQLKPVHTKKTKSALSLKRPFVPLSPVRTHPVNPDGSCVTTYFYLQGKFKLQEISACMGMPNTYGHESGSLKQYDQLNVCWDDAAWEYSTLHEQESAREQLKALLYVLYDKKKQIQSIHNQYECEIGVVQVLNILDGITPVLEFDPDVLAFLSEIHAKLMIDSYA